MEMDNTIIAAIIGAFSTIIGAFITRGFVLIRISNPNHRIGPFSSVLIDFFSKLTVKSGKLYWIPINKTIVDNTTEITISVHSFDGYRVSIYITEQYKLPKYHDISPGWVYYYMVDNSQYRLTYFESNQDNDKFLFEIRRIISKPHIAYGKDGNRFARES